MERDEGLFRALLETLDAGVVFHDSHGRVVFANAAAARILGVEPAILDGTTPFDSTWRTRDVHGMVVPADARPTVLALRTGEPQQDVVMEVGHGDGEPVWVSINAQPVFGTTPDLPTAVVVSFTDITDRVRAEARLRESEQRLETLFEHSSDVVLVIDELGVLTYISPAALPMFGYAGSEWIGRNIFDLVHPDHHAEALSAFASTLSKPGPNVPLESRVAHADGRWRWVEVIANNLLDDPMVGGIVVNVRDVTERLETEAALHHAELDRQRQAAEAEYQRLVAELARSQQLESLGRLAASVAHDFSNLLGVISNYAQLARRRVDSGDSAMEIEHIQEAATEAGELVRRLLALGRTDPGTPETVDLNTVALEGIELLGPLFGRDVKLTCNLAAEACLVRADRRHLEQMLINLLLNARDALRADGTITVATAHFDDAQIGSVPGPFVEIAVLDDGVGMSPDVQSRAIEPFFTTKPLDLGSGLGLATVHATVRRLGGQVTIDSQPGEGTTVRVRIPAAPE